MSRHDQTAAESAQDASREAEVALEAAQLTIKAAKTAGRHAAALKPDPPTTVVGDLAQHEQSALLRFGPRRNRWRHLDRYEQRLVEIEQRRAQLIEAMKELRGDRGAEPDRYAAELDDRIAAGEGWQTRLTA